jgi:hypothetical protein
VNRYTPEERDRFACTFQNKEKEQVTNLHTLAALAANTTSVHLPGWLGPVAIGVIIIIVLAIVVKTLWKVPDADEALIITGFGVKGRAVGDRVFKVVTGGGAFVWPVLQKAQYLGMSADKALLEVEGVDSQKIPVGVRGVAIFKVGDDERASSRPSRARCTTSCARSSTATCARSSAGCRSRT